MKARVYRSSKREFECKLIETGEMIQATALGNLVKGKDTIVVGDFVEIEKEKDLYKIVKVQERTSEIFRILVREAKKKVTAANVDVIVIFNSVSKPDYKRGIVDRFLVRASQWGIHPIVVFNKMDEYDPDSFAVEYEEDRLEELGVECFEISGLDPEYKPQYLSKGFKELKEYISGKTSIFLGQSGVGKSQTINSLAGSEVNLKTNKVGKVGKGSHTTTWSEIVECGDFDLIDSPGIRTFSLEDMSKEGFIEYFPDLEKRATQCKFNNCTHLPEAKGCFFFNENNYEDEYEMDLVLSRLDSYLMLLDEVTERPFWNKRV